MVFDPKINRNTKDAIGDPGDTRATDSTSAWTMISLLKGIFNNGGGGGGGGGSSAVDDAAFVPGTGAVTVIAGMADETAPDAVDEGDAGAVRMTLNRALHVNIRSAAGTELTLPQQITDDAAFAPAAGVVTMIGGFADETAPDSVDEGDGGAIRMTLARGMHVNLRDATGTPLALGSNVISSQTLRTTLAQDDPGVLSLSIIDDWDETDRCKVNLIAGQAGITAGSGTIAANTPRVCLATDQPNVPVSFGASAASGGITSTARILTAAASTNATSVKGSAGRVYAIQGYNVATATRYLKLYNKATAPTVGSDTPVKTVAIPPGAAFALDWPVGYSFATGIALALTTGVADADTGALTAGDIIALNVDYA